MHFIPKAPSPMIDALLLLGKKKNYLSVTIFSHFISGRFHREVSRVSTDKHQHVVWHKVYFGAYDQYYSYEKIKTNLP